MTSESFLPGLVLENKHIVSNYLNQVRKSFQVEFFVSWWLKITR